MALRLGYVHIGIADATRRQQLVTVLVVGTATIWLTYTRLYFWLQPRHLTYDPSLFMWLTGRPDPGCGLTRTFAWMWRGDVLQAMRVYPLGPLLFAACVVLTLVLLTLLVTRKSLSVRGPAVLARPVLILLMTGLAINWSLKLAWLGM